MVAPLRPGRDGRLAGGNARRSSWREWEQVTCPTLIVLAQSGTIPQQDADEMLRQRPATVAVSIPRTGHDLHLEQSAILHVMLTDFLEGLA
jgi:pimeloyl-ACP methyl ester carboxylesterase